VADLRIDGATGGVDPPTHRGSGGCAFSGVAGGRAPAGGPGGEAPQKLKPKNTLEASQKALR